MSRIEDFLMPQSEKRDPNQLMLGLVYGAVVLWVATYFGVRMLHHSPVSPPLRVAGVTIAVLGFVAWQLVTAKLLLLHDEFTRQILSDRFCHRLRGHWTFHLDGWPVATHRLH